MKFKLHFSNDITVVKEYKYRYNNFHKTGIDHFKNFILSETNAYERKEHLFSHISKFTITFISEPNNITYEYYLTIPKPMIDWKFITLLARNPKLVRIFESGTYPLIKKYNYIKKQRFLNT